MIMHWLRHRDQPHWRRSLAFNATGAVLPGIVFVIEGVTKFTAGARVSIVLIGLIIVTALHTRRYYDRTGKQLALRPEDVTTPALPLAPAPRRVAPGGTAADRTGPAVPPGYDAETAEHPDQISNLTIVPVAALNRATMRALAYAAALGQPTFALHISPTTGEADRFRGYWQAWGNHLPLETIVSPHRALIAPLVNYIWTLHRQRPDLTLTVAVPELVVRHWWHRILHDRIAWRLRRALQPLARGRRHQRAVPPGPVTPDRAWIKIDESKRAGALVPRTRYCRPARRRLIPDRRTLTGRDRIGVTATTGASATLRPRRPPIPRRCRTGNARR